MVGGCLSSHWSAWEDRGADAWVVEVLLEGYVVPFISVPPLSQTPIALHSYSPQSVKGRALESEIRAFLQKGAVELVSPTPGYYNRMFVVTKASGGWRPIIDLSILNNFVVKTPFRMETTQSVLRSVRRNNWMVTVDLKDAYLQVPVHPASRKFFAFRGGGKAWQFRALCFGLTTAPQVFTWVMALVSSFLHRLGLRILLYLNDWLVLAASREEALWARDTILQLCEDLGMLVNLEKSSLIPSQDRLTDFLGFTDSFEDRKVLLNSRRISVLKKAVCEVLEGSARSSGLSDPSCSRWSAAGEITSVGPEVSLGLQGRVGSGGVGCLLSERPSLVVRRGSSGRGGLSVVPLTRADVLVRRIRPGLGSQHGGPGHFGSLVSRRENSVHKCQRTSGSGEGSVVVPPSSSRSFGRSFLRQHDSVELPSSSRGHSVSSVELDRSANSSLGRRGRRCCFFPSL